MNFIEKNNFVVKHAGARYFDADLKLFKKVFPQSKLITNLERANQFNKKSLDERMLLQLLDVKDGETILNNRKGAVKKPSATKAKTKQSKTITPKARVSKTKPKAVAIDKSVKKKHQS